MRWRRGKAEGWKGEQGQADQARARRHLLVRGWQVTAQASLCSSALLIFFDVRCVYAGNDGDTVQSPHAAGDPRRERRSSRLVSAPWTWRNKLTTRIRYRVERRLQICAYVPASIFEESQGGFGFAAQRAACLFWQGVGSCSEEQKPLVRENSPSLGIMLAFSHPGPQQRDEQALSKEPRLTCGTQA